MNMTNGGRIIMGIVIAIGVVFLYGAILVAFDNDNDDAMATHSEKHRRERPCSISISSPSLHIPTYEGHKRSNPDGSVYPGDAVHYLFKIRGSDTCTGFGARQIVSDGAIDVSTHKVIIGQGSSGDVRHISNKYVPETVTTIKYYKLTRTTEPCDSQECKEERENRNFQCYPQPCKVCVDEECDKKHTRGSQFFSASSSESNFWSRIGTAMQYTSHSGIYEVVTTSKVVFYLRENVKHNHGHSYEDTESPNSWRHTIQAHCSNLQPREGCVYGHIDVDLEGENEYANEVELEIYGKGISCYKSKGKIKCNPFTTERTASMSLKVLSPVPDVAFGRPVIHEFDGYDSKNIDSTYYIWDTPAIQVMPDIPFRDVRHGIISFEVKRTQTPITEIFSQNCHELKCRIDVKPGNNDKYQIGDTSIDAINGDQLDVLYAESSDDLGRHNLPYAITVKNIGREISKTSAETDVMIVVYDPVFSKKYHASIITDSPGSITWEKKNGVSLQYLGSQGTGPDDHNITHQERRAKITDYFNSIVVNTLSKSYPTNATSISMRGGEDIADIMSFVYPSVIESSGVAGLGSNSYEKSVVSLHNSSAVFTNAGFGKIAFSIDNATEMKRQNFGNVTTYNTLVSSHFGGEEQTLLYHHTYQYPGAWLESTLNVTAINSDISIDEDMNISAELAVIKTDDLTTVSLAKYMYDFITKERGLPVEFAEMYLGDMYDVDNTASGDKGVAIGTIRVPAVHVLPDIKKMLGISEGGSIAVLDEEYAYASPVAYNLNVDAGGITNTIKYHPFGFSAPLEYTINADDGNTLKHMKFMSTVHVATTDVFGDMKRITVDGKERSGEVTCKRSCIVNIQGNGTIFAENIWGGTATLHIEEQIWNGTGNQYEVVMAYVDNVTPYVITVLVVFTIGYVYFKYVGSRR